jgi:hypothetical protein
LLASVFDRAAMGDTQKRNQQIEFLLDAGLLSGHQSSLATANAANGTDHSPTPLAIHLRVFADDRFEVDAVGR